MNKTTPEIIFLIGMPAVGKTYWGTKIAEEYGIAFTDLDVYIEQEEQASIPALFASYGEKGFREKESAYLTKIVANAAGNSIIACGGGTPCFNNNIALLKKAGTVIYLQADIAYLIDNIRDHTESRPLLNGRKDLNAYLQKLLADRKSIYEQAHYILHTKDISLTTFGEIISSCINRH